MKKENIITIEGLAGSHLNDFTERLVNEWNRIADSGFNVRENGLIVQGSFNGTMLICTGTQTPEMLQEYYSNECRKESEAYRKSPEGKREQLERELEVNDKQAKFNALMNNEFPSLNYSNHDDVLDFILKYHKLTDHIDVKCDHNTLITALKKNGYETNANTGADFKEEDPENYARYIIGQFMDCVQKYGACPPVFETFYERYKEKFNTAVA